MTISKPDELPTDTLLAREILERCIAAEIETALWRRRGHTLRCRVSDALSAKKPERIREILILAERAYDDSL